MPEPTGVTPIADIESVELGDVATFEREVDAGEHGVKTVRVAGVVVNVYALTYAMTLWLGPDESISIGRIGRPGSWRFLGAHRTAP